MPAGIRKRRDNASDVSAAKRPPRELTRCPNCYRYVGSADYIMCAKCDSKVHLLCTQLTSEDAVNKSQALSDFVCSDCSPASDYEDSVSDMDAEAALDVVSDANSEGLLRAILKEVLALRRSGVLKELQTLRRSNRRLEREVCLLSAKVDQLTARANAAAAARPPSARGRQATRQTNRRASSRPRSISSCRSNSISSVSFARQPVVRARNASNGRGVTKQPLKGNERSRRAAGRVPRPSQSDNCSTHDEPNRLSQPTPDKAALLPVARCQLRHREIFVGGLEHDVSASRVHSYLKQHNITALSVKKIEPRFSAHSSFIVAVTNIDYTKLFDERLWATGTIVKNFKTRGSGPKVTESFPVQQ